MNGLFYVILEMSISASILVLVVLLLRLILKKAPKWVSVLLWALVAIRLICPFAIESPFSLMPDMEYLVVREAESYVDMGFDNVPDDIPEYVIGGNPIGEDEPTHTSPTDPVTQINRGFSVELILSLVWLSGIAVMLTYMIVSCVFVYRRIQRATQFRDNVYTSTAVTSPFVFGIVKPRIYLPESMDAVSMSYVIAHEEAHVRRRDHWWKPLGFILLAVHWFNPVIWLAYIFLCRDIEMACDERVISEMGERERVDYSEALLDCSVDRRMITACPLAFGENNVKERIMTVLNYKKPAFWIVILAVVACVVAAICFLTNPQQNIEDSTLIPYNTIVYHSEQVSDNEHNRDVNIIKIDTDSTHSDTIFQAITQKFDTILVDYMNSVPYEFQNLVVDSTYCENEEFLCLAVIASLPSQYPIPYETGCIFWNRAEDKLYSLGDYLNIIGIDQTKVESSIDDTVNANLGELYKSTIDGMFYLNNNIYFIIQVESNFENGINATETMFYNYSSSELILGKNFSGFNALKDESDTIEPTNTVIGINDHISTPKPVLDYALSIVKESIAEYNELGISQKEITGTTYTITDARIDSLKLAEETPEWLNENEYIYKMEFWLKPSETDETKIFLAGEMFLEHGWFKITNRYLLMKCENSGATEIWTPIGVIDAQRVNEYTDMYQDYRDLSYIFAGGDIVLPDTLDKSLGLNVWSLAQAPIKSITYGANTVFQGTLPETVENIYVSENNTKYISMDGILYSADGKTLITFPSGRKGEYRIPDGVEVIGASAFWGCNLTNVYVPDSVERICSQAFSESKFLTNISLPMGIMYDASETPFPLEWIDDINSYRVRNSLTVEYRGTTEQWNLDTQYLEYARTMNVVATKKSQLPITITEVNRDTVMEHGTHEYIHEQSEYTRYFQISTRDKYTNIRITSMTLRDTGMEIADVHYTFPELTSQKPLLIGVTFYGDMTTYGLLLTDTNGVEHQYMIYESGKDGSVVLQEY